MQRQLSLNLVAILALSGALAAAETAGNSETPIARLIRQLGSERFADREAASRELDALGPEALDSLKTACQSDDAEVRHRAALAAQSIEKRLETARLLT